MASIPIIQGRVLKLVNVVALLLLLLNLVECRDVVSLKSDKHTSHCRKHKASLADFGGVNDGKTSNTKAFKAAIDQLGKLASDGGSMLIVPPGKWLTGSFNLTSHFTLYIHKDAVLLGSQDEKEWPLIPVLPSYGRGRDAPGNGFRYQSLIFGTNLTDLVITGSNGTIDGQGATWWDKLQKDELNFTRPYLIEIMYSNDIQIFNLTLLNSPNWNVHPVYSRNIFIQGLTIRAPTDPISPNTDGINPDSCTNVRIEDCFIVSGDDCVAIKSGWDQYGIAFGMPTKHVIIRRLTCISPESAVIALGSEMSGGIRDVRAEDITAINTESGVRIKSAPGRGGYVKNIFVRKMNMHTMKYVFWMTGAYGQHADDHYDPNALPEVSDINYSDMVGENVTLGGNLGGLNKRPFKDICMSNVTILAHDPKKSQWNCTDVSGVSSQVSPKPCSLFKEQPIKCAFPTKRLPIEDVKLKVCTP
ncbi:hypothetical protein Scep_026301 [Stephania cephalantha]|uniref:Polygalacturonase n=1 Tax=Stephania cephalantha TaxID=152367 RepID=A0AAP0EQ59_9MAGN